MGYINATTYPSFGRSLRLYWEERNVNTDANTSDIYWELQGYNRVADSTGFYAAGPFNVTINGVKVANNIYPSGARIQLRADTVVARGTLANIAHDADGSKSVTASFSCDYIYDGSNTAAGSGSIMLTTIPRASAVTVPDGTFGQAWIYTLAPASSTFSHDVAITIGTHTISQTVPAGATPAPINGTITQGWADAAPTTTSATVTVTVITKSAGTTIGTTTETATFYVPDSWKPTSVQPTVVSVVDGYSGDAIQSVSKASIRVRYQGGRGASLANLKVYGPGINTTVTNPTANEVVTTGTLTRSGTNTWTVTVTDSRGRQATQTVTLNVTAYRLPTVKLTAHRCDSNGTANDLGDYMTATAVCTMDTSIAGNRGRVEATLTSSGGTATSLGGLINQSASPFTLTTSPPVAAASTASFLVTATVKDSVLTAAGQSVIVTTRLSTAQVLIDFKPTGDGIAFGGSSTESQVVAVKNWDLHLDNPLGVAYGGTGATGVVQTTWTPTVTYSDGTSPTVSNISAKMDRLGPIVHLYGYFRITALGSTGNKNLRIGNLPVAIKVPLSGTGTPFFMSAAPADGIPMMCQVVSGGQSIDIIRGPQAANSRPQLVAGWCSFDLWAFVA